MPSTIAPVIAARPCPAVDARATICATYTTASSTTRAASASRSRDRRASRIARVKRHATVECHRWIWLWLGDAADADPTLIPDPHWLDDPDWTCTPPGYLHDDGDHRLINDNLLDFPHLSYVHPETLGGSEAYAQLRSKGEPLERGLRITRWFVDHPPAPFVEGLPRDGAIEFRRCQAVTPERENASHYFFAQPRNFDRDKPEVSEALFKSVLRAFEEDRQIITAQARRVAADGSFEPLPCALDSALMQFRQLMARHRAGENGPAVGSMTTTIAE